MELGAVAARAGVSPGLPYRYFESKSALVAAVVDEFFDGFDDEIYRPDFAEVSDDWWVREAARLEALVAFFYREPLAPFVFARLAGDAEVVQTQQRRIRRQVQGAVHNLGVGKRLGRVQPDVDEELVGAQLIGGVQQTMMSALVCEPPLSPARVVDALKTFMQRLLQIVS